MHRDLHCDALSTERLPYRQNWLIRHLSDRYETNATLTKLRTVLGGVALWLGSMVG